MEITPHKFKVTQSVLIAAPTYNFLNGREGIITKLKEYKGRLYYSLDVAGVGERQFFENELEPIEHN